MRAASAHMVSLWLPIASFSFPFRFPGFLNQVDDQPPVIAEAGPLSSEALHSKSQRPDSGEADVKQSQAEKQTAYPGLPIRQLRGKPGNHIFVFNLFSRAILEFQKAVLVSFRLPHGFNLVSLWLPVIMKQTQAENKTTYPYGSVGK